MVGAIPIFNGALDLPLQLYFPFEFPVARPRIFLRPTAALQIRVLPHLLESTMECIFEWHPQAHTTYLFEVLNAILVKMIAENVFAPSSNPSSQPPPA